MDKQALCQTAAAMVASGKGILAMDESHPTCEKRFRSLHIEVSESKRRDYRRLLVTTANLNRHISAAILFDETLRQTLSDGTPFAEYLTNYQIIPGIKVDQGLTDMPMHPGEKITKGIDTLEERLQNYTQLGAKFAKWRAVFSVNIPKIPSAACVQASALDLARYAAVCQKNGLVPIVEPEILMDGGYNIEDCLRVTSAVLHEVFYALSLQDVILEAMVLKPNMAVAGSNCPQRADADTVARATLQCLEYTVPKEVPGIAFLSGGQSDDEATDNLRAINCHKISARHPWRLTFSYGRALQQTAMAVWGGKETSVAAAQKTLAQRAQANAEASLGN